jgi:hypothetical protein
MNPKTRNRTLKPLLVFLMLGLSACDAWVKDVQKPIDQIADADLNSEAQIKGLVTGVENRFGTAFNNMALYADLMSDAFVVNAATATSSPSDFSALDSRVGIPTTSTAQNGLATAYTSVALLRFATDDLLSRIQYIGTFKDPNLQKTATFKALFYAGVVRYFLATYWGAKENEGGGTINGGTFQTSEQLYVEALVKLDAALAAAPDEGSKRYVNTLKSRIYLFRGDKIRALTSAQSGLVKGDADWTAKNDATIAGQQNVWWLQTIGLGLIQVNCVMDARFANYIKSDPKEENRVPVTNVTGTNGVVFQRQNRFKTGSDPISFVSWQENELILAELELANGNTPSALSRVNGVRLVYALDPLTKLDQATLMAERDKTFMGSGLRLPDQRRTNTMHASAGTWNFIPLPAAEYL